MKITKIIAKRRGIYAGNRRFLDCIDGTIIKKVKETMNNAEIGKAMVIKLDPVLPEYPTFKEGVRRAPKDKRPYLRIPFHAKGENLRKTH